MWIFLIFGFVFTLVCFVVFLISVLHFDAVYLPWAFAMFYLYLLVCTCLSDRFLSYLGGRILLCICVVLLCLRVSDDC